MRETVGVCPKSPVYGIFKATGLDFGGNIRKIARKRFDFLHSDKDFGRIVELVCLAA
jgi:hypothetical protein